MEITLEQVLQGIQIPVGYKGDRIDIAQHAATLTYQIIAQAENKKNEAARIKLPPPPPKKKNR